MLRPLAKLAAKAAAIAAGLLVAGGLAYAAAFIVPQGGTGQTSLPGGSVLVGNGTGAIQSVAPGTSGNVLTSNGTAWTSAANTATGFSTTSANYWLGTKSTSNLTEGSNLYYTNARGIGSTLTGYTSGAGTISSSDTILGAIQKLNGNIGNLVTGVSSVFGRSGAVVAQSGDYTTSQVTEGSNLYYTLNRFASALAGTTTTALAEGTNLYYTAARDTANFISNLAATTSVKSITTLPSLTISASQISGILGVPSGGTGAGSFTAGNLIVGNSNSAFTTAATTTATCSGGTSCASHIVIGSSPVTISSFSYPFPSNSTSTALTLSGGATIGNNVTLSGITGSTQCLHVNSSGVVTGTGSDCGSGSGSGTVSSGTQGQAAFYNANGTTVSGTSTLTIGQNQRVGVGSTTPGALFAVHANNGDTNKNIFVVASSTGSATTSLISVTNTGAINLNPTNGVNVTGESQET